ncbi:MAG: tetratricopeptide repeat protein [Prochlorococcus sp.]
MTSNKSQQALSDALWNQVQQAITDNAWSEAEGLLWRILQLSPQAPCTIWDTLGYTLLMQGDYKTCEQVLRPWSEAPERTFWLNHKLADALRGQSQHQEAATFYQRSLLEGSTSSLTYRNLLQVLYELNPDTATKQLNHWANTVGPNQTAWQGAREAAVLVPGLELAQWLWEQKHDDGDCRRRLLEEHCYTLSANKCWRILQQINKPTAWEQALSEKLHQWKLIPTQAAKNAPAADGPQQSPAVATNVH